jgi:hypothetical protein
VAVAELRRLGAVAAALHVAPAAGAVSGAVHVQAGAQGRRALPGPRRRQLAHLIVSGMLMRAVQFGAFYAAIGEDLQGGWWR